MASDPIVVSSRLERWVTALFCVTAFQAAALIFLMELMVAKWVLPSFGGSATVWNVSVLFFQTALLLGYAYAHGSHRLLRRRQWLVHLPLLALPLLTLPVHLPGWAAPDQDVDPTLWLLLVLTVMAGAGFLALSTSGPVLQAWLASTTHRRAADPYFLYAASNIGSFAGLVSYPLLVEPNLTLVQQARWWSAGYVATLALFLACAVVVWRTRRPVVVEAVGVDEPVAERVTNRRRLSWVIYAAVPSGLMLALTTFIATDIASFPLLWVVPLSLYLLTFVVAFGRPSSARQLVASPVLLGLTAIAFMAASLRYSSTELASIVTHLIVFALVALAIHRALAARRPPARSLTDFYLCVSFGGVVGGAAVSLLAPLIFSTAVEYHLMMALALALLIGSSAVGPVPVSLKPVFVAVVPVFFVVVLHGRAPTTMTAVMLVVIVLGIVFFAFPFRRITTAGVAVLLALTASVALVQSESKRSFYGIYRVEQGNNARLLYHGSTLHGAQSEVEGYELEPTTYYTRNGPLGDVMSTVRMKSSSSPWAMIGLGAGTALAYGQPGDVVDVYEIDQLDVDIASDAGVFTFVSKIRAQPTMHIGDGRLEIAKAAPGSYDLIVLDAFSSDAIPTHLLTKEALAIYKSKLTPGGIIAVHISNRNVNLLPVVDGVARSTDLHAVGKYHRPESEGSVLAVPSLWVALSTDPAVGDGLRTRAGWESLSTSDPMTWTDDYSNVIRLLRIRW